MRAVAQPSKIVCGGWAIAAAVFATASSWTAAEAAGPKARAHFPAAAWSPRAPLPVAMAEVGVAAIGVQIHVIGGTEVDPSGALRYASRAHYVYDAGKDAWREAAPYPVATSHLGVAVLDGKLYAVGGFSEVVHIGPQNGFYVYDPATDVWSALPPLPRARGSVALAAIGGKLHAFGGRLSEKVVEVPMGPGQPALKLGLGTVTSHDVYDPRTNAWTSAAPIPGPPRDHMGIAVLRGKAHLFGGRINDFSDLQSRHDIYDPARDAWTSGAPLRQPRSAGAYAVVAGGGVYAGGECRPGGKPGDRMTFRDVALYSPRQRKWRNLPDLPEGRQALGAAVVGHELYLLGGSPDCGGGASRTVTSLVVR